jgi:hypothetical protein
MNTKKLSYYVLMLLAITLLSNCKKHHKDTTGPTPEIPPTVKESKRYIPIKLEYDNTIKTLKYLDNNTTLLSEMESSDGRKEIYSYNSAHKPVKYECYQAGERVYLIDYLRNSDGFVVKANRFAIAPRVYTPDGYNTFTYDTSNKLISFKTYDNTSHLTHEKISEYGPSGDLIKTIQKTTGQPDITTNLSYDDKNGIFKEVSYRELLAMNGTEYLVISAPHNLVDRSNTSSGGTAYRYQYNTDNYPSQYTVKNGNGLKTIKVTYRAL